MRYIILTLCTLALLALPSCTKEDVPHTESVKMVEVAIIAETTDATRLGIDHNTTRWEVGDRITLGLVATYFSTQFATLKIESASDISADGKRATFRGTVPEGSYYGVAAVYPAVEDAANIVTLNREAADNIFMHSFKGYEYSPINVTTGTEIPVTFSHVMHKMTFRLSLAAGYTSNDLEAENIAIEVSGTSEGRAMEIPQKATLDIRNGTLTTTESATSLMAYGRGSEFHTMLFPMGSTKSVVLTFGIYIDGQKRYEITKPEQSLFTMTKGKNTTVNLVLSASNLTDGGGSVEQKAITLVADRTTIKANGTESATLSVVDEDGKDVTSESTIFVDGARLSGTRFTTTTAGTYRLYAERNGVRSNEVTITATEVTATGKTIVFAEGVTLSSGWYDVNKYGQGSNGDIQMCWAASASNIIQWWQDRYVAAGGTLPSTAISGAGSKDYGYARRYELALMDMYHDEWDNTYGGHVNEAIPWYFEGKLNGGEYATADSQAVPKTEGGYWKSIWPSVVENMYCGYDYIAPPTFETAYTYTVSYNNYYLWGNGSSLTGTDRLKYVSDLVVRAFDHGMASMTISLSSNIYSLHHAVTLWGYEIDNTTGLLTRVWITDSDDLTSEPKTEILHEMTVSIGEGKSHIQFSSPDIRYKNVWLVAIVPVAGPNSK